MTTLRQVKKQLVHAAVVDNVDLIEDRRAARARARTRRRFGRSAWMLGVLALTLGGVLAAWSLSPPLRAWASERGLPQVVAGLTGAASPGSGAPGEPTATAATAATTQAEPTGPETIVVLNPEGTSALRFDEPPIGVDQRTFSLGLRTVVLDPGHGGVNSGTEKDGLREKDITLDIAQRLESLLLLDGFDVLMTRREDVDVDLYERVAFANRGGGDLFLSIHVNWLGRAGGGVETFYLGTSDDPRIVELTAAENRDSGYTLKDFRNLLDGLYVDLRRDESRNLAQAVQRAMHSSLRELSPKLRDRGVKTAPFVVLIGTEMPAVLAEVSSLSDEEEARLLADSTYRQRIAEALHDGVLRYAASLNPSPPASSGGP
ncbi:MAG: N-acetylmuramoyl-L-alanine amidase [Acidobacteria bacterium]|nr:MAG: N-acetylmuramoyl-L-alanine amidase [Acidobacteriota bacterium]REK10590.1 MAG: N-acetylmuramoyl-L-alanine amidase [Acidobacteriota bacterium]